MLYTTNVTEKYNNQIRKLIIVVSIIFVLVVSASTLIILNEAFATGKTSSTKFLNGSSNVTDVNWGQVINATLAQIDQENITK
jgi:hypothetical protein